MARERVIMHVDMDAFFAAIEQRDNPELRGRPVVVGADPKEGKGRGVVAAASYEAREFGIHSAMPIGQAWRRCPEAAYVRPRMDVYAQVSGEVRTVLEEFTPQIEPVSIDEAFLDVTGTPGLSRGKRTLAESIARRIEDLTAYQSAAYARRYSTLVRRVEEVEAVRAKGMNGLTEAVARYLYKLMAYKDEYEVARLYADGDFAKRLREQFEGDVKLEFNLAPPLLAPRDKLTGEPTKKRFGPWMMRAFGLLARLKGLRGTALDPFGRTEERRMERKLITEYEAMVAELLTTLDHDNHALSVEIASVPELIRGYGHVKQRHLADAKAREAELLEMWRGTTPTASAAE